MLSTATRMKEVDFTALKDASKADIDLMTELYVEASTGPKLAERVLAILRSQGGADQRFGGKVDLLEHGLQTATRALRDGADEETIVVALLHDVGELLSPSNHGEVVAGLLRPYIGPQNHWILANHEIFQGYYYFEHLGGDKNKREKLKDSPYYQACVDFCEKWDQSSFDPDYEWEPLETFVPMVERVLSRDPYSLEPDNLKRGAVLGE